VLCCYPEVEQRRRQPQKATIVEISARLARLERTITAIAKDTATPDVDVVPDVAVPRSETAYPATVGSPAELLVRDGDTSRYINEMILSRILDEVSPIVTNLWKEEAHFIDQQGTRASGSDDKLQYQ
jgi:hypothetical protein